MDRLSSLPDEILCQIISKLPTRDVVVTSVLSTKWKYLLSSVPVPVIDLDASLHPQVREGTSSESTTNSFIRFAQRVIMQQDACDLVKFRLVCTTFHESSVINAWIDASLLRSVQEIDIRVEFNNCEAITREIFTCKTLVVLKLGYHMTLDVPELVVLPKLKVLELDGVTLSDVNSIKRVFFGCPLLEDLHLHDCQLHKVWLLDISIPSLKRLRLSRLQGHSIPCIETPNLEYLHFIDFPTMLPMVDNLKSVVRAEMYFGTEFLSHEMVEYKVLELHSMFMTRLIREMFNVKFLTLRGYNLRVLSYSACSLPKFQNLTNLDLAFSHDYELLSLPILLNAGPNLEKLVLDLTRMESHRHDSQEFSMPENEPICLTQHLKLIEIINFGDLWCNFYLVEYLLRHGEILEKMTFQFSSSTPPSWPYSLSKMLSTFTRLSKMCKVVLRNPYTQQLEEREAEDI